MPSKYPILPPKDIIKALRKIGFEKCLKKVVMQSTKTLLFQSELLSFQCILKLRKGL